MSIADEIRENLPEFLREASEKTPGERAELVRELREFIAEMRELLPVLDTALSTVEAFR